MADLKLAMAQEIARAMGNRLNRESYNFCQWGVTNSVILLTLSPVSLLYLMELKLQDIFCMNLQDEMRVSILRAILERPDNLPEALVTAARTLEQAKADAKQAEEDKKQTEKRWATAYGDWQRAGKVARRIKADRTKAEKDFRKMLTRYSSEISVMNGLES